MKLTIEERMALLEKDKANRLHTHPALYVGLTLMFVLLTVGYFYQSAYAIAIPRGGGDGAGGLLNVVEDLTPQLGGDLDLNGNTLVDSAGNMVISANGAGQTLTLKMATGNVVVSSGGTITSVAGTHTLGALTISGDSWNRTSDANQGFQMPSNGILEIFGSDNDSATAIGVRIGPAVVYTVDGSKIASFAHTVKGTEVDVNGVTNAVCDQI